MNLNGIYYDVESVTAVAGDPTHPGANLNRITLFSNAVKRTRADTHAVQILHDHTGPSASGGG